MSKTSHPLYTYLMFAGALPFLISAVLLALGIHTLPFLKNVQHLVSVYGLVIASFIAGAHWGQHFIPQHSKVSLLLISSNVYALLLWISYLVLPLPQFFLALITLFMLLLWVDTVLYRAQEISTHYFYIRCIISGIVIASLAMIYFISHH